MPKSVIRDNLDHVIWTPRISSVLKKGKLVSVGGRGYMELKLKKGVYGVPSTTRVRVS